MQHGWGESKPFGGLVSSQSTTAPPLQSPPRRPGAPFPLPQTANVMIDLAIAMKYNPNLKVLLNAGYFDLATPFFEGMYEMGHLPIPQKLQSNIDFKFYESGHMVYLDDASRAKMKNELAPFYDDASAPRSPAETGTALAMAADQGPAHLIQSRYQRRLNKTPY